jgi:MFS family permease
MVAPTAAGPVATLLFANLLFRLAGAATGLMLTLYLAWINRELYPVSATTLGLLAGAYSLVEMVLAPTFGAMSDRRGARPFLIIGPSVGLLAVTAISGSTALALIFTGRLLEGVAGAAATPSILSRLAAVTDGDDANRGRAMGFFEAGTVLGLTLGSVIGSLAWESLGRAGFGVAAVLYVASLVLFLRVGGGRVPAAEFVRPSLVRPSLVEALRTLLGSRPLLAFMPAWLAVNMVVGLWLTHAIFQMTAGRQMAGQFLVGAFDGNTIAVILTGYTLAFGLGIAAWGYALRWVGEIAAMRVAMSGMLAATLALWAINRSAGEWPMLPISIAVFGAAVMVESGFAPAAVSYLARLSSDHATDRGLFMGLYSVVLGFGQLLGGWLGGPLADLWALDGIVLLTLGLAFVALCLTMRLRAPRS